MLGAHRLVLIRERERERERERNGTEGVLYRIVKFWHVNSCLLWCRGYSTIVELRRLRVQIHLYKYFYNLREREKGIMYAWLKFYCFIPILLFHRGYHASWKVSSLTPFKLIFFWLEREMFMKIIMLSFFDIQI